MPNSLRMVKSVGVINYKKTNIQEVKVQVPLPITSKEIVVPTIVESFDNVEHHSPMRLSLMNQLWKNHNNQH